MNDPTQTTPLALITGGTRGIGRAIAVRLTNDGMRCVVTGTSATAPSDLPPDLEYHAADLRDGAQLAALCDLVRTQSPSVLVNNAGISPSGETESFSLEDFDATHAVNVRAPFALMQSAVPGMRRRGGGRIVNITSIWGVSGSARNVAYGGSKSDLDGMTAALAAEVAGMGILVNSVAPGYVLTEAAEKSLTADAVSRIEGAIPLGRLARPSEVAALVSWLVGSENSYVTGQNVLIDGGLTRTARP